MPGAPHPPRFTLDELERDSPDGMMAFTSIRGQDARITDFQGSYCNPSAERIIGKPAARLLSEPMLRVLPGNRQSGLFDRYVQVVESGEPQRYEFPYTHDGLNGWYEAVATRLGDGFAVRFREVTSRVVGERALRASESDFRRLAESLPDIVTRFDRQRRHQYVSSAVHRLTGIPVSAFLGKTNAELGMPAESVTVWDATIDRAFAGEVVVFEFQFKGREGVRHFESHVIPERDELGNTVSVLCVARDVTEQRRLVAQLRERAELEEQLIGIVSHDLRQPLQAILISTAAAFRREGLADQPLRTLQRIHASAERASRMVRDLLDFTQARLGNGLRLNRTRVSVAQLIRATVDEVQATHPERSLRWAVDETLEAIWDGDRVAQALANLLINALTYGAKDSAVAVAVTADRGAARLSVHNQGPAIPPNVLPMLFQPLQRGADQVSHTVRSVGLGLYIVKQIASAHGGSVEVASTDADGTSFTLKLPLTPAE